MKKNILCIILAIISGSILGKMTFDRYEKIDVKNVIKLNNNVYMLKYGTYNSKEDMKENIVDIQRYIYIQKDNKYNVYVAVAKSKESINKLKKIYSKDYEIEKINISNNEFIQNLDEYEKLIKTTNDIETLNVIENEILSCYEKMVVNDE